MKTPYNALVQVLGRQPLAWREGFFYAIQCKFKHNDYIECIESLDAGNERLYFHQGWETASKLYSEHSKELNG